LPWAGDDGVEEAALAALLTADKKESKEREKLVAVLSDPAASRRAAAALLLGRAGDAAQRAAVRARLRDPDAKVRLRAAQGLLAARQRDAVPALLALLASESPAIVHEADDALAHLAGAQAPRTAPGVDATSRKQCQAAWEKWWRDKRDKLDLTTAEVEPLLRNPDRRAREVGQRFLDALCAGDAEGALRASDVPFVFPTNDEEKPRTPEKLEKMLTNLAGQVKSQKYTCNFLAVQEGETYLAKARAPDDARKLMEGESWRRLRAVHFNAVDAGKSTEPVLLFVRVRGGTARVVALLPGEPVK
jgi:hypothetical protein